MADYKQLCAELIDELSKLSAHIEATTPFETVLRGIRAYNRARAALAEPAGATTTQVGATSMTDLSPAARAIWEAFNSKFDWVEDGVPGPQFHSIAAALRAVANQVMPERDEPDWGACNDMRCDIELYGDHQRKRAALLAIADELENND